MCLFAKASARQQLLLLPASAVAPSIPVQPHSSFFFLIVSLPSVDGVRNWADKRSMLGRAEPPNLRPNSGQLLLPSGTYLASNACTGMLRPQTPFVQGLLVQIKLEHGCIQ